jgi:DNA end-binding protein Ku
MEQSELAGLVRYVFHDRERLGCLRVRDRVLVLERMYFADEVRPHDEIRPKRKGKVADQELELALSLIERITSDFDPSRYEDRYRERLLKVIRQKRKGKTIEAPKEEKRTEPPDLLAALRESVERAQSGNGSSRGNGSKTGNGDLGELSVKQLTERARKLEIGGRSSMTKRQLITAIEKAER